MPVDIRHSLKKLLPRLLKAQEDNLNESDTVARIRTVFEDVLGYDRWTEISSEAQLKEKYVDLALKVDGVIRVLVECKAAGVDLREKQIEQAWLYASQNNYPWVVLTNGVRWHLYHLTFSQPAIEYDLVFAVDLKHDDLAQAATMLTVLHRQSVKKAEHEDYWKQHQALGPASIGRALFQERVLLLLRREIHKRGGPLIDIEDLAKAIRELFSPEARERMGPIKIYKQHKVAKKRDGVVDIKGQLSADEKAPTETKTGLAQASTERLSPLTE